MQSLKVFQVNNTTKFGKLLEEYSNGYLLTCGFYPKEELTEVQDEVISITYDSNACTELPINWPDLLVLDDNDKRQKIKQIDFDFKDDGPVYLMEDGTRSWEVTL